MALKSLGLLRMPCLSQWCKQTVDCACAIAKRTHANILTSPILEQDHEEKRVQRELEKRCIPASGSTTTTTPGGPSYITPQRCPVMKLRNVHRQLRTFSTIMNPFPSSSSSSDDTTSESMEEDLVIDVPILRK